MSMETRVKELADGRANARNIDEPVFKKKRAKEKADERQIEGVQIPFRSLSSLPTLSFPPPPRKVYLSKKSVCDQRSIQATFSLQIEP
jgi:hypothetical protein